MLMVTKAKFYEEGLQDAEFSEIINNFRLCCNASGLSTTSIYVAALVAAKIPSPKLGGRRKLEWMETLLQLILTNHEI